MSTASEIVVGGEKYRQLAKQRSAVLVHGLWGAHMVEERLYRLLGLHNGPTIKPLLVKLGVVDGSLLPDLADEAGELLSKMTSRDVEATLTRQGFRPPSRTTLVNRLGGMLADISTGVRELESECRCEEELDFELGAISCELDRFAGRMDEVLPEGPARTEKLNRRRAPHEYQRTPPEPYDSNWRMAWAANVTLYDKQGRARRRAAASATAPTPATASIFSSRASSTTCFTSVSDTLASPSPALKTGLVTSRRSGLSCASDSQTTSNFLRSRTSTTRSDTSTRSSRLATTETRQTWPGGIG